MTANVLLWMVGIVVFGASLMWWGFRGKRLNDHPVCRQCRFDLSGAPEGTITCPECGAGLKRPGSTRIGQRRRRPLAVGLGAILVGLPLFAIGTAAFAMLTGSDLNKHKPLGLMLWEAKRLDSTRLQPLATELVNRYTAKQLDDDQVASVVETVLEIQGDPKRVWCLELGSFLEQARNDGKATKEHERQFRKQATVLDWRVRPRVRAGDPIPVVISLKEARIGGSSQIRSMMKLASAKVDGSATTAIDAMGASLVGSLQLFGPRSGRGAMRLPSGDGQLLLRCPDNLEPGRHSLSVKVWVQSKGALDRTAFQQPGERDPDTQAHECELSFEVIGNEEPAFELIPPSDKLCEQMELAISASMVSLSAFSTNGQVNASIMFSVDSPPVPGAFDVFLKHGDQIWDAGFLTTGTSADRRLMRISVGTEKQRFVSAQVRGLGLDVSEIDVVLRPSVEVAARTIDVGRMYGAEILCKGVRVQSQAQASVISSFGGTAPSAQPASTQEVKPTAKQEEQPAKAQGSGLFRSLHNLLKSAGW
jgi:hypothetical protein